MDDERGVISGTEFDFLCLWGKLDVGPKNRGDSLPKLKLSVESREEIDPWHAASVGCDGDGKSL